MKLEDCTSISATSTTVMTANGSVDTNEKARVNGQGWDLFATAENTFPYLTRRGASASWMCVPVETRHMIQLGFNPRRAQTGTGLFTEKHVARCVSTVECFYRTRNSGTAVPSEQRPSGAGTRSNMRRRTPTRRTGKVLRLDAVQGRQCGYVLGQNQGLQQRKNSSTTSCTWPGAMS